MKKYVPNKYICYLYFLVPLLINAIINYSSNEDIWYIMKYGKVILENGFIHTDILSMHSGLHIVIQQSFSNVLFYLIYKYMGSFGFFLLCELMIGLYLFLIYKICMLLSNKKVLLSVLIATITCTLLEVNYITPSPRIFTYLNLLLIIYIMEVFYKNNKSKLIYFLPLISLLQINFHGALWYFIFLFMLPYIAQLIIDKNKNVWKIICLVIVMFLVGFINPYTYENVFFPFLIYDSNINHYISELYPMTLGGTNKPIITMSLLFYSVLCIQLLIYIYCKKGKLELRHLFLLGGTTLLALVNNRSFGVFLLGSLPILSNYLKNYNFKIKNNYVDTRKVWVGVCILILIVSIVNHKRLESSVKAGGDFLDKNYSKDIVLYTGCDYGSYLEYLGFHPYTDTRAEVYTKKGNKKQEIFMEAINLEKYCYNYEEILSKYKFTHLIVAKNSCLYYYLINAKEKVIFDEEEYAIFEL